MIIKADLVLLVRITDFQYEILVFIYFFQISIFKITVSRYPFVLRFLIKIFLGERGDSLNDLEVIAYFATMINAHMFLLSNHNVILTLYKSRNDIAIGF